MYYTLCRAYIDPGGPRQEQGPNEERSKLSVSFSGSRSIKLQVSVTTNQLARSRLIAGENDSLGGRESENETDNFSRFLLGCTVSNWTMTAKVVDLNLRLLSS